MESYAAGPSVPLIEKTIPEVLAEAVAQDGGREAIVSCHQGLRLTCRDLARRVAETAAGLWGLGVRPARISHQEAGESG